jgi:ribulose-phosphate 3-epimerase
MQKDIRLEVDGGIKESNIFDVSSAGADTFVAGSAIFNKSSYVDAIQSLKNNFN